MTRPAPYPTFIAEWTHGSEINLWLQLTGAYSTLWARESNWIEANSAGLRWRLRVEWLPAFLLWAHGRYSPEMFAQLQREAALRQIEEAQ